jgi:hypothetical protein
VPLTVEAGHGPQLGRGALTPGLTPVMAQTCAATRWKSAISAAEASAAKWSKQT